MKTLQEKPFLFHRILVMCIALLVLQPGAEAQCSELSGDMEIYADWWSVLPYSTRTKEKNGNYSYSGRVLLLYKRYNRIRRIATQRRAFARNVGFYCIV